MRIAPTIAPVGIVIFCLAGGCNEAPSRGEISGIKALVNAAVCNARLQIQSGTALEDIDWSTIDSDIVEIRVQDIQADDPFICAKFRYKGRFITIASVGILDDFPPGSSSWPVRLRRR